MMIRVGGDGVVEDPREDQDQDADHQRGERRYVDDVDHGSSPGREAAGPLLRPVRCP